MSVSLHRLSDTDCRIKSQKHNDFSHIYWAIKTLYSNKSIIKQFRKDKVVQRIKPSKYFLLLSTCWPGEVLQWVWLFDWVILSETPPLPKPRIDKGIKASICTEVRDLFPDRFLLLTCLYIQTVCIWSLITHLYIQTVCIIAKYTDICTYTDIGTRLDIRNNY